MQRSRPYIDSFAVFDCEAIHLERDELGQCYTVIFGDAANTRYQQLRINVYNTELRAPALIVDGTRLREAEREPPHGAGEDRPLPMGEPADDDAI